MRVNSLDRKFKYNKDKIFKKKIRNFMKAAALSADQQNLLKQVLFGDRYIPTPNPGEGAYDAFINKNRSLAAKNLQADAILGNPVVKSLGIKDSAAVRNLLNAGSLSPAAGKMLSPLLGGDVSKATGNIYEGMRGANVMGNYGRVADMGANEAGKVFNALSRNFYKHAKEKLMGGEGDFQPDKKYNKKELKKGVKHESEHTHSKSIAKEIAKDHLEERSDYYSTLAKHKIGCLSSAFKF
jgi:hypothetical protein